MVDKYQMARLGNTYIIRDIESHFIINLDAACKILNSQYHKIEELEEKVKNIEGGGN